MSPALIDRPPSGFYAPRVPKKTKRPAREQDDIRDAILTVCRHRDLTPYRLAKLVAEHDVSANAIYTFLADPKGQLRTQTATRVLRALGIRIVLPDENSSATN